jgi:TolB-like protein
MSFFAELKRRNVVRVGIAYVIVTWLLAQVAEFAFDNFGAPEWVLKTFVAVLLLGLPLALIFAWAFEITPEGVKRERDVDRSQCITSQTGRKLDVVIIGLMAIAIGYFAWDKFVLQRGAAPEGVATVAPSPAERTSIAVLPFDNMSGDPGQQYFSDGMTEEIIAKLALIDGLRVISRTTVEHHKEAGLDVPGIARQLKVGFVLEGSVRKSKNRIRVTAQLIQTSDDSHLWASSFDSNLDDIFTVQETIAREIVDSLGIHLTDSNARALAQRPTNNVSAYEAYLQGQALVERWQFAEMLEASRTYFNQALALDPNYANALAGLASVEAQTYRNIDSDPQRLKLADDLLDRALAIDPELHRAIVARGEVLANRYDYPSASEQFRHAVEMDPENYFAWDLLCWSLGYETPPRAKEAETACRNGLRVAPHYVEFYYHLARALAAQERFDEARQTIDEMQRMWPDNVLPQFGLFWISLGERNYEQALQYLDNNETSLILAARAAAYSGMGQPETAIEFLDNAMAKGFRDIAWLTFSDHFAATRALPAYRALLNTYGLALE